MANEFDNIKIIVNWNANPEKTRGARQVIHSTVSRSLPDGDYNVYVGKVIDSIAFNAENQLVFTLRLPEEKDLSPENLNRKPLTHAKDEGSQEEAPRSIMEENNQMEIMKMKQDMVRAEREIRERSSEK